MDSNGPFAVSGVTLTPTPFITASGNISQVYTLTFRVGTYGTYSVQFPNGKPSAADILATISAQVDDLRAVDAGIAQLNQRP